MFCYLCSATGEGKGLSCAQSHVAVFGWDLRSLDVSLLCVSPWVELKHGPECFSAVWWQLPESAQAASNDCKALSGEQRWLQKVGLTAKGDLIARSPQNRDRSQALHLTSPHPHPPWEPSYLTFAGQASLCGSLKYYLLGVVQNLLILRGDKWQAMLGSCCYCKTCYFI